MKTCAKCGAEKNDNAVFKYTDIYGVEKYCCRFHGTYRFCQCEDCDSYFEVWNNGDRPNSTKCPSCLSEDRLEYGEHGLHEYGYKPSPIPFGININEPNNSLLMGVELEMDDGEDVIGFREFLTEDKELNPNNSAYCFFYAKYDGSLSEHGNEVVCHPATLNFHKSTNYWKLMLRKAISSGFQSNNCSNCGIHIHVNKDYFTTQEIHKLDALVNLYSKIFRRFARRRTHYANYDIHKSQESLGRNNNDDRYSCLNFENEHTIEWRIFKGNLKYESIMALLELIQGVSDFIKQEEITIDMLYNHKDLIPIKLKTFLESKNFDFLPRYTEMCRVWRDINENTENQQ